MKLVLNIGTVDDECFDYYQVCLDYLLAVTQQIGIGVVGLYGSDNQRSEAHEVLIQATGIDRTKLQQLTDHLDKACFLELTPNYYQGHETELASPAVILANKIWRLKNNLEVSNDKG
jgi:hypothetical protein